MLADLDMALIVRKVGRVEYAASLAEMRKFTAERTEETPDELWVLEHPPVYTLGLAADPAHGPKQETGIPVVQVERGGEVTYHGPGQVVIYTLIDIGRLGIKVREYVHLLEQCVIDLLGTYGVTAARKPGAPGVYVNGAKVAALGIRVSHGCTLHGLALNVDMELAPFGAINPCGYPGLVVTQTRELGIEAGTDELGIELARRIARQLEQHHA